MLELRTSKYKKKLPKSLVTLIKQKRLLSTLFNLTKFFYNYNNKIKQLKLLKYYLSHKM